MEFPRFRVKKDPEEELSVFVDGVLCLGGSGDPARPEHSGNQGAARIRIPIQLEL
jgi:hypothetical protein